MTAAPGLFFAGLPWQDTRGSAPLGWVNGDAAPVAAQISARSPGAQRTSFMGAFE